MLHTTLWKAAVTALLCGSLVVMWGQGTEATASPQSVKDATFTMLPALDVMFTEDVLWERPARSRLECSVMCRGYAQCLMFTFRPPTDGPAGSCRSHVKRHIVQGKNESVPGARSLSLFKETWIQKTCNISSDCREPMAACFSGQCLCDGGFFFDHNENACVKTCDRGVGSTYLEYRDWDLLGHDRHTLYKITNSTTCKNYCNKDPLCLAFDRWMDKCHIKLGTAQDFPSSWMYLQNCTFYQKTCV